MRAFRSIIVVCLLLGPFTFAIDKVRANQAQLDPNLILALKQAVSSGHSLSDELEALAWLADMSQRLTFKINDPFYRVKLLETVHAEAFLAQLQPELVLAVIEVESTFERFAVSHSGAHGLMQVMPFWKKEIGHPRDDLFNPRVNLRYGCAILKYYLDRSKGDLEKALQRYNGSPTKTEYAQRVLAALRNRWLPKKVAANP